MKYLTFKNIIYKTSYRLMSDCWNLDPTIRTGFIEMGNQLKLMLQNVDANGNEIVTNSNSFHFLNRDKNMSINVPEPDYNDIG